MPAARRAAKAAFRAAGLLSRVRTSQRACEFTRPGDPGTPVVSAGRGWRPCGLSTWLLSVAERLDWDHFGHWATEHDGCAAGFCCQVCGGTAGCPCDPAAGWTDPAGPVDPDVPPPEGGIPIAVRPAGPRSRPRR